MGKNNKYFPILNCAELAWLLLTYANSPRALKHSQLAATEILAADTNKGTIDKTQSRRYLHVCAKLTALCKSQLRKQHKHDELCLIAGFSRSGYQAVKKLTKCQQTKLLEDALESTSIYFQKLVAKQRPAAVSFRQALTAEITSRVPVCEPNSTLNHDRLTQAIQQ